MEILLTLREAIEELEKGGLESPKLDAEVLLAHTLGCERHEIYLERVNPLTPQTLKTYRDYIERRKKREPVAYIRGFKEFWSLPIKVTRDCLIPRPETERLIETALKLAKPARQRILDLCTGSGAIAAALAQEYPNTSITAADICPKALQVARENLKFAGERVTFIQSNLFEKIDPAFDLIVSNPPYIRSAEMDTLMPEVINFEPSLALDGGPDGLAFIRQIRQNIGNYLKPGGTLILENGPEVEIWKN